MGAKGVQARLLGHTERIPALDAIATVEVGSKVVIVCCEEWL